MKYLTNRRTGFFHTHIKNTFSVINDNINDSPANKGNRKRWVFLRCAIKYSDGKTEQKNNHHDLKGKVYLSERMSGHMNQMHRFGKYLCFVIFLGKADSLKVFTGVCKCSHHKIPQYSFLNILE